MSDGSLVYLFSSNIRPLYVQDILDVLAAPTGASYFFRYEEKYVAPAARESDLAGRGALVHFAIQQEARYHAPAFIPVRRAQVVAGSLKAGMFVIEFIVGDYVALKGAAADTAKPDELAAAVRRYTDALEEAAVERPYDWSASLGPDLFSDSVSPLELSPGDAEAFRSTARTLQRTEWFRRARFVRVLRVQKGASGAKAVPLIAGFYQFEAGATYQLELTHFQPGDVTGHETFKISAGAELLQVIGRQSFEISSRYDLVRIPVHATLPARDEARETILAIAPSEGVQGPTIQLPIRVQPPKGRAAALTAASAVVLVLFGLPAVFTTIPQGFKFLLVFVGALGASWIQGFGWTVSVPAGLGFTGRSASSASSTGEAGRH